MVVREYGRDSLVVWANLLLAPVFAALGLRVGLQSADRVAARMADDEASMRRQGYLVTQVESFALPVLGSRDAQATWYRVTYEQRRAPAPQG
jgi:hypothetical protein